MDKAYVVYTDFSYDGICIEGVASDMEKAREIAKLADPECRYEVVIEVWEVDTYTPAINRGNEYVVMVIKNGQEDTCHTKKQ